MSAGLMAGAIVMDTASVKLPVMQAIAQHLPSNVDFIPAHPIAGSESSGIAAGRADLFQGKRVVLTPNEPLQGRMLETITRFWSEVGARVEGVPPDLHDVLYAHVSHLPQLLAFACRNIVPSEDLKPALKPFTRLQSSSAELWADIFTLNREPLIMALDRYMDALWHVKGELAKAPDKNEDKGDALLARQALMPRIIASCLITTVMECEKKLGFSFARYAGQGFADFTSPASAAPEGDIESISDHYLPVLSLLQDFLAKLTKFREQLLQGDKHGLASAIQQS
jgi:prephenate dehydrogenase